MTVQRRTRQREAVQDLLSTTNEFRTAQELHAELRERGESVGLTTVYRNLTALAEAEEVDVLRTPNGELAYRRCSVGHHHHLVCRQCSHAIEITAPALEKLLDTIAAEYSFSNISHDLELFGTCSDCATSTAVNVSQ